MLFCEIKKNIISEQLKKNIIPLLVWPLLELIQIIYNYNFSFGTDTSKIFGLNKGNLLIFVISTYLLFSIFDKNVENSWRINFEKYQGVISQFFITPYPRVKWLLNRSIASFFSSSLAYCLVFILYIFSLNNFDTKLKLYLLLILVLAIIISIVWGALLISIFLLFRDGSPLLTIFTSVQYMVSGVQVPFRFMPKFLSILINIIPLSYLSSLIYDLLIEAVFPLQKVVVHVSLFIIILFSIIPIVMRTVEQRLKVNGNFDLF